MSSALVNNESPRHESAYSIRVYVKWILAKMLEVISVSPFASVDAARAFFCLFVPRVCKTRAGIKAGALPIQMAAFSVYAKDVGVAPTMSLYGLRPAMLSLRY